MESYAERRKWSDSHMDQVRCILGKKFFQFSTFKQDTQFGIDLYISELKLAVRIRQSTYKNFGDFTIRTSCPKGLKSEYAKLLDKSNQVDFIFYAWAFDKTTLSPGFLIDINAFKASLALNEISPKFRRNKDGSHFVCFPLLESFAEQLV